MKIKITREMFHIAYSLSKQRQGNFTNQFTTIKLKEQLSDDPVLAKNIEGVIGYIGDMCASIILGLYPLNIMRNMLLDTVLLTHRDECDLVFNGHRIDVKTEFYPAHKFDSVINRVSLADAQIVVGAGRGLKDPTNWAIIEELASILNAATACSKPVSDLDWRPHYEHVGQTGVKIAPSVYIACGISGAIQHLAGVNSSKTIVVINNDPDAPFFTNADYGIIGDVFDIVPRLINKLKNR
jgi:hypothetical protein